MRCHPAAKTSSKFDSHGRCTHRSQRHLEACDSAICVGQCSSSHRRGSGPAFTARSAKRRVHCRSETLTPNKLGALGVRVPDLSMARKIAIPPLDQCFHFVNLTNGLEAIPHLTDLGLAYQFCRIQSTWCEQQKFEEIVLQADAGLMMAMATGQVCLVWDFGSRNKRRGVPRAIWYGLEFLRYATASRWLKGDRAAFLRGYNTSKDFDRVIKAFSKTAKNKLRYYGNFVPMDMTEVQLYGVYDSTNNDSDQHVYTTLAHTYLPSGCRQTYAPDPSTTLAELRQYIEPRVLPHMNVEQLVTGPPLPALHSLGFSAFHGGVCSSVVRSQGEFYNDKGLKTAMR